MTADNFRFYLKNRLIQTGQKGGASSFCHLDIWLKNQTFSIIGNVLSCKRRFLLGVLIGEIWGRCMVRPFSVI
jgi:hypothetical protein